MLQTPGLVPAPVTVPVSVTPAPGVHTGPVTTGEVAPATLAPALGLVTPVTAVTTSVTQPRLVNTLEAILIVSIDIVLNEIVIKKQCNICTPGTLYFSVYLVPHTVSA